jgi:hypothetical protein
MDEGDMNENKAIVNKSTAKKLGQCNVHMTMLLSSMEKNIFNNKDMFEEELELGVNLIEQ